MRQSKIDTLVSAFWREYRDEEIDKRLFFSAWADRVGCDSQLKLDLWEEVKRATHSRAARRRAAIKREKITAYEGIGREE